MVYLARENPELDEVFGPISRETERRLRLIFGQVDEQLLGLAVRLGHQPDNWAGGLYLRRFRSGPSSIAGHTGRCITGSQCVQFYVELRPSPINGTDSAEEGWDVEAVVEADCQHAHDHGGLETVWDRGDRRVPTPEDAASELLAAAKQLHELGRQHALDHWLALASD